MTLLPRAIAFTAPAVLVLAGSLYLSDGLTFPTFAADQRDAAAEEIPVAMMTADEELVLRRVARKQETTVDLMEGRIDFAEAVLQFRDIVRSLGGNSFNLDEHGAETIAASQVLSFVRAQAQRHSDHDGETLRYIEHQAAEWAKSRDASR